MLRAVKSYRSVLTVMLALLLRLVPGLALASGPVGHAPAAAKVKFFSTANDVTTEDTRYGSCGLSWLYLTDTGALLGQVDMGAESSYGTMWKVEWRYDLYKYYTGSWSWVAVS